MTDRPDWAGRTCVAIASGPSLTAEDCELVRAAGHPVIVTNTTFRLCPWADAMFAFDTKWWKAYGEELAEVFAGRKFGGTQISANYGAESMWGVDWFRGYRNSGCCAISLAIGAGASRIIMLGYDAKRSRKGKSHWHGDHPAGLENVGTVADWPRLFGVLAKHARRAEVEVLNASRETALTCFRRAELEIALAKKN